MMDSRPLKQRIMSRQSSLWRERSTWINRYQIITDFLLPFSGRYFSTDRNKGTKSFNNIYDSSATKALGILNAGMMAGMTSPARPWFRLAVADKDLMEYDPVRQWLHDTAELMRDIYAKSNTYNGLHSLYEELGAYATGVSIVEDDFDTVLHHTVLTAGEYALGTDDRGRVNTVVRKFEMTVEQVVGKFVYDRATGNFDWSKASPQVKNLWDGHKNLDAPIEIVHAIQPREERDVRKRDAKNMPWMSVYVEAAGNDDRVLRDSGYKSFPAIAPRWHVRGGDVYGHGPSFQAIGDIQQLQHEQLRKGQALEYMVKPPLQVPAEQRNSEISMLPGGVSYIPTTGQTNSAVKELFNVNVRLDHLLLDIQDVRQRINSAFYADLFLMISQDNRATPATATEVAERHEEKLLMLGPVLERLHNEMLSPMIDHTFARIVDAGIVPPPPPELQDMDLKVEFISTLAQAQKMVGIGAVDGFLTRIGNLAAGSQDPSVWDKVDKDQVADKYADMYGVDPSIVVADEKVAALRGQRAKAMAAQQAAAMAPDMARAAKDASQTDTTGKNALTDMLQGYSTTV